MCAHIITVLPCPVVPLTLLPYQLLGLFWRHCLPGPTSQVTLHPNEDAGGFRAVVLDLRVPLVSDILKRSTAGDIKADDEDIRHGV